MKHTSDEIVVISSYPPKGAIHHASVVGGGAYAKDALLSLRDTLLQNNKHTKITVLAEKHSERDEKSYTDEDITVKRLWTRFSLTTFPLLLKEILLRHTKAKRILIQFEFSMFGFQLHLLPLLPFLLVLRIAGKQVFFVFHQVVTDVSELDGHLNIKRRKIFPLFYNTLLSLFYKMVMIICTQVIVLEATLKNRLSRFGDERKIVVIPLTYKPFRQGVSRAQARQLLGIPQDAFVLLSFGYVAWYKGTDWLIDAYGKLPSDIKNRVTLIIAGGATPNHIAKDHYRQYVQKVEKEAKANGVLLTGFVPEEDIPLYYQACDLSILPYRSFMSHSGPLSLSRSFGKPFLISEVMRPILSSYEARESLLLSGLVDTSIVFSHQDSLETILTPYLTSPHLLSQLTLFSRLFSMQRLWRMTGAKYFQTLFTGRKTRATVKTDPMQELISVPPSWQLSPEALRS